MAEQQGIGMVWMLYRALNDVDRVRRGVGLIIMHREREDVVTFDLKNESIAPLTLADV